MSNLDNLRRDLVAADAVFNALGSITPSIRGSIEMWFPDVEVEEVYPLPEWPFEPKERHRMIGVTITEMRSAVEAVIADGLQERDAFEVLAPVLDPLYREFYALQAQDFNAAWREMLPSSQDELDARIEHIEAITGLDRDELRERAGQDRRLLAFVTRFGVTLEDLG
jgi:hypothetical protein